MLETVVLIHLPFFPLTARRRVPGLILRVSIKEEGTHDGSLDPQGRDVSFLFLSLEFLQQQNKTYAEAKKIDVLQGSREKYPRDIFILNNRLSACKYF